MLRHLVSRPRRWRELGLRLVLGSTPIDSWNECESVCAPSLIASEPFDVDAGDTTEKLHQNGEEAVSFTLSLRGCEGVIVIGTGGERNANDV